jgi:hypothetical protein
MLKVGRVKEEDEEEEDMALNKSHLLIHVMTPNV